MRPESPSISIIVPTLNEAENIEGIIAKILAGGSSLSMEIIVVDDGSKDATQSIVTRLGETAPVVLLARDRPKDGLAGAVLAGARAARAGVVLVIDADGSHPPEKIPALAGPVIRGEKDMVIGSRYAPGGSTPGWSRKRRLMSRAASACAWPLTDVHDALSGFFAVRRELLAGIPSDAAGFKVALEVLVRGGDAIRVGEVPIAFRDRELGQSKMGTGVILTYFRRLLALSGWRESQDSVATAIAKTALVWIVDFAIFALSLHMRSSLSGANLLGFAAGALLNGWLKRAQLPAESRTGPVLGARLVFVSLLALFLRGGVLGTCVRALRWAPQAAILPAIVTGWVVLYLGYALFIWPVREQYGRGVRWRVAAMGAAAYLVALRVVYMYTMPTDARLAAIPWKADGLTLPERVTAWLRHGGTMAFGGGRAGLNGPALLCWGVGAWAVFKLTQRVMDKTTAFRALLLFSVLPVFFWMGAVFSPDSLLVAGWAVALWLGVFANRRKLGRAQGIAFIVVEAIFWGLWAQPGVVVESGLSWVARAPLFFVWQAVLVTPLVLIEVARAFTKMRAVLFKGAPASGAECDREITVAAAGAVGLVLAAVIGILVFVGYMENRLGLMASGAIWLPLLPWIAADMQKPGRWWGAVIYGCVVLYGGYLYWLAFPRWR